jgi:glyceraldehyde 3-phosphate dehydrogenase
MTIRVAINGFGRIGRAVLRATYELKRTDDIRVVAINSLGSAESNGHLTKYDTVHGRFNGTVEASEHQLVVNGDEIKMFSQRDITGLPWKDLGVDLVLECTGAFATKEKAAIHLKNGAKKILISAPAGKDVDATIVYGVNHLSLKDEHKIVSNASCTTNCLAPLVKPLHEKLGIKSGIMTTVHSVTNDQSLSDVYHEDLRRARSATQSIIPTKTGAASAIGLVLPDLDGKLDGFAVRVPTINVSLVDLTFIAMRATSVEEVNSIVINAAKNELKGILDYNKLPLVSVDFNHTTSSSIFDATQTKVIGELVKVLSWYDNEWAFAVRMLDVAKEMFRF